MTNTRTAALAAALAYAGTVAAVGTVILPIMPRPLTCQRRAGKVRYRRGALLAVAAWPVTAAMATLAPHGAPVL